jgi:diguanylate cyclase (GGDEF)-like protein
MDDKNSGGTTAGADGRLAAIAAMSALVLLLAGTGAPVLADWLELSVAASLAANNMGLVQVALLAILGGSLLVLRRCHEQVVAEARHLPTEPVLGESDYVRMAYTDELTGLPNRRRLEQKLTSLVERRAGSGRPFGVALINLDGFKPINDVYGHAAGDEILRQVALRLAGISTSHGTAARLDGDEFAVLATNLKSPNQAAEFANVLSEILSAPYDLEGRRVRLSGSFGIALYPESGTEPSQLLERAGTALYRAKKRGRGQVAIFNKAMEEAINEDARVEQALRQAIADKTIRPYFQPIVDLQNGHILGFEALARWRDQELGQVSPAKFIPIAEERGLIGDLTEVLLFQAAHVARSWPRNTFLSFNLSTAQLADPGTGLKLLSILSRAGLDPHRLEIEITETAVMSDPEMAREIISGLRSMGVRVALDDFGTGHSSLGYLRQLTLDKVKIDRCFIMGVGRERESDHIVRAILEMCTGLELKVVAEGIEESAQAERLRTFGCNAGQGFLFGRPMEAVKAGHFCLGSQLALPPPPDETSGTRI